jgi:hypothetical protein
MPQIFPEYVMTYNLTGSPIEVAKPPEANRLVLTVSQTIRVANGGNAGPIPLGGVDDGTGTFHVHPSDSPEARSFDVSEVTSVSFAGTGEVALIWGFP